MGAHREPSRPAWGLVAAWACGPHRATDLRQRWGGSAEVGAAMLYTLSFWTLNLELCVFFVPGAERLCVFSVRPNALCVIFCLGGWPVRLFGPPCVFFCCRASFFAWRVPLFSSRILGENGPVRLFCLREGLRASFSASGWGGVRLFRLPCVFFALAREPVRLFFLGMSCASS